MRHDEPSEDDSREQAEDDQERYLYEMEERLDQELQDFIATGESLAACSMLPEKLRELIGEAVRAAKGCRSCKMPLGALHALDCSETRYEWDLYKLRRVVATHDLSIYPPNEEQPARDF